MLAEYLESVITELESLDYPALVEGYRAEDVARAMYATVQDFYVLRQSHRICAIVIWSMTMNYQIMSQVKH